MHLFQCNNVSDKLVHKARIHQWRLVFPSTKTKKKLTEAIVQKTETRLSRDRTSLQ